MISEQEPPPPLPPEEQLPSSEETSIKGGRIDRSALKRGATIVILLLVAAYGLIFVLAGADSMRAAWDRLELHYLALPLLATFLSYLTMSISYEGIVRAAGANIGARDMFRITLVANTANYIFPSGGLTGFALRLLFFTKRGITPGTSVAISFTQTLLTNLMLMLFVVYGLVNLLLTGRIQGTPLVAAGIAATLLAIGFLLLVLMIYSTAMRQRLLGVGSRLVDKVLNRTGYHGRFAARARRFFGHIDEGMGLFAGRPGAMVLPSFWIFLDWLFMMGALWLGFYATGRPIGFSLITIAFSVSSVLAFLSFVPGAAGVLEGSLAVTLASLGVPIEDSALPIFLYRFCYFVVPTVVAFFLAHGAFTGTRSAEEVL